MSEHFDPQDPEVSAEVSPDESEEALFQEALEWFSRGEPEDVFGAPPRLRGVAGCEALLALGQDLRHIDPDRSAAWVACADLMASRLEPGELGERELEDFRCSLAVELVIFWLIAKQPAAAEATLARAARSYLDGTLDPSLKASLLESWCVYHAHMGETDKAMHAARTALALFESTGERDSQGRVLYRMSILEEHHGRNDRMAESLRHATEAVARLDPERDPGIYLAAVQQQATCLVDLRRYREARRCLFESLSYHRRHGDPRDELQRLLLEGLINSGLGKLEAAERDLLKGLLVLEAVGIAHTFGVIALDLCAVLVEQGRAEEARATGLATIGLFQKLNLPPGGQKAMLFLEMAFDDGLADADLLRRTARFLRELQYDPEARFRPRS